VEVGGVAVVDKGEIVIPSDQSIAVKSGEAVVSSPHLTGPSNVLFTQPNPVDLSSQDKGFVDHGPSTDPDAWKGLADQVKAVGDSIAAQDKARAAVADQMLVYQAETAHAQQLLATATQSGNKEQIALAQQYVAMMGRLIDSTVSGQQVIATAVMGIPGIQVNDIASSIAAAIASGPMNKTPLMDPTFSPATGPADKTPLQDPNFNPVAASAAPKGWRPNQGSSFSGYDPYNTPSFDIGGPVGQDMLAMVHAGEWVIPNVGKISLPPEVMARIRMPSIPGAPNVPDVPFSARGGGSSDSYTFIIQGITDPDVLMREISSRVKTRTGRTAKFSN